jgi:hypothetical protein
MKLLGLISLSLLTSSILASDIERRSPYVVKGEHPVPPRWQRIGSPPADHPIELRIGLKSINFDELESRLYQGSTLSNTDAPPTNEASVQSPSRRIWPALVF